MWKAGENIREWAVDYIIKLNYRFGTSYSIGEVLSLQTPQTELITTPPAAPPAPILLEQGKGVQGESLSAANHQTAPQVTTYVISPVEEQPSQEAKQERKVVPINSKKCLNNAYCAYLAREQDPTFSQINQMICLVSERSVFDLNECPKGKWFFTFKKITPVLPHKLKEEISSSDYWQGVLNWHKKGCKYRCQAGLVCETADSYQKMIEKSLSEALV